ncbi:MAG: response regulator transcription factor [Clostridia bacterium]|nr:response regulator transcription factor [Clostridia bacterium]
MSAILIVEDEISINTLICKNLTLVGHKCTGAYDGTTALQLIKNNNYDLIILDVMLPGFSGFEIITYIKDTPVIFVTAKSGLQDKLKGLELGADDYIVKPFEMQELLARVAVVLRRVNKNTTSISFDNISVEFNSRKVFYDGNEVKLTPKEFDLLEALIINRNIALTRERLLDLVWDIDFEGDTRTVDIHIQQLRKKLGLKNRIKSMYKIGYRFEL